LRQWPIISPPVFATFMCAWFVRRGHLPVGDECTRQQAGSICQREKFGNRHTKKVSDVTDLMVFTGNANPDLARKIVAHLGMPLGEASVTQFSDGEIAVELLVNVRGRDVFVVQPTCAPTNDNLMELIVMV